MTEQRPEDYAKFKRLATKRVNNAVKHLRLVGNLSNTSNYHYHVSDPEKMLQAIEAELADARKRFKDAKRKGQRFQLT